MGTGLRKVYRHWVTQPVHGQSRSAQASSVMQWLHLIPQNPWVDPDFYQFMIQRAYELCHFYFPFRMVSNCGVLLSVLKIFKIYTMKNLWHVGVATSYCVGRGGRSELPEAVAREGMLAVNPAMVASGFSSTCDLVGTILFPRRRV